MRKVVLVLVIFIFFTFIIFWPVFSGKVNLNGNLLVSFYAPYGENLPFKNSGWDQLRIYFPFLKITQEAFGNFQIPFWNPYAFSGHPHMADFQTGVFYPLNFIGIFLPQIWFWHLLRITPTIFASIFTFLYLRNLKLNHLSAFFGAITFGFSPFILTWGEEVVMSPHSIYPLPLILFSIDRFLESKKRLFLTIISFSFCFSILAGYIQTSIYLSLFAFGYLILKVNIKKLFFSFTGLKLLSSFLIGVGLAALQLIPSAELFFNSARSSISLKDQLFNWLLPIKSIFQLLSPDIFGHPATYNFFRGSSAQYYEGIIFIGIAAFIFAIYTAWNKSKNKFVLFYTLVGLISLSSVMNFASSKLLLSLPIPFLSSSIPNRMLFIFAFAVSILASIGLNDWLNGKSNKILNFFKIFIIILSLLIIYLLGARFLHFPYFTASGIDSLTAASISLRNLALPFAIVIATSLVIFAASFNYKLKNIAAILIIFLSMVHIFFFSQKYFSFTKKDNVFPNNNLLNFIQNNQGIYRTWSVGEPRFTTNFATQYQIFSPDGYDSLNNRSYSEFTYAMQGHSMDDYIFRADAGLGFGNSRELLSNSKRRKLVDLVGVKYTIVPKADFGSLEKYNFKKVFESEKYGVFENMQVVPRVFLASGYEKLPEVDLKNKTQEKNNIQRLPILERLLSDNLDYRNILILEKSISIEPKPGEGSATIISYKPQEVLVKTKSAQPKLLFLSDNFYPGWKATVDGNKTEILRADYTFRALSLGSGDHLVKFYFDSTLYKIGFVVSMISLVLCFKFFWPIEKSNRKLKVK